jgi:hypothetical protein
VLQQARVLQKLAIEHKEALADHGWDDGDATQFASRIEALEAALGGRAQATNESDHQTKSEQSELDAVKAFLRRLRLALPRVLRENTASGITATAFAVETPWGRSTPKAIAYLIKIRPAVLALDASLKKYFAGKNASDVLDTVKLALEKADTDQESAQAEGPVETQALNATVGQVLEDVEDVIRAGKSAFDGDAPRLALFNKDLILRARGHNKDEPTEPPKP